MQVNINNKITAEHTLNFCYYLLNFNNLHAICLSGYCGQCGRCGIWGRGGTVARGAADGRL